jgi:ABC-type transport system involved in cytochrome c biogenesis permease subunit
MEQETTVMWVAIVAYVISGTTAIFGVLLGRKPEKTVLGLLVLALACHTLALGMRWDRLGHGPFVTMFEILSSNVWSLALVFALAYWRIRAIRPVAAVVMPILFLMLGWMLLQDVKAGALPATYHTVWLFVHIGFAKVFLGSVLVAVGLAIAVLLREAGLGRERLVRLPANDRLDELAFRWMALGLIFHTLMLIAGAIWAQDAWGRYWAWDPLETWSFITWLTLVIYVHLRFTLKISLAQRAVMILAVFGIAFLTFFGVPFLSEVPHKGAV